MSSGSGRLYSIVIAPLKLINFMVLVMQNTYHQSNKTEYVKNIRTRIHHYRLLAQYKFKSLREGIVRRGGNDGGGGGGGGGRKWSEKGSSEQ